MLLQVWNEQLFLKRGLVMELERLCSFHRSAATRSFTCEMLRDKVNYVLYESVPCLDERCNKHWEKMCRLVANAVILNVLLL